MGDWDYPGLTKKGKRPYLNGRALPLSHDRAPALPARWACIKNRVSNPSHKSYSRYSAVGMAACFRSWPAGFLRWCDDLGLSPWDGLPESLQVDRIDNRRGYEPGNQRLVTSRTNNRNRSSTIRLQSGETLIDRAELEGVSYSAVKQRWAAGERDENRLFRPERPPSGFCSAQPTSLNVFGVQAGTADVPGHVTLTVQLPQCAAKCSYCFAKELWDRGAGTLGWSDVRAALYQNRYTTEYVCFAGADPMAQPLGKALSNIKEEGFRTAVYAVPWHSRQLSSLLGDGLLDWVHLSLLTTDSPMTKLRSPKFVARSLDALEASGVEYAVSVTVTPSTECEVPDLRRLVSQHTDHELHVVRAI